MASAYPGGLDSLATNKANSTPMVNDHATVHNDLADAINSIEAELGTNPRGSSATVKARLDTLAPLASPSFTGSVGIGTNSPFDVLDVTTTSTAQTGITAHNYSASNAGPGIMGRKARGTAAAPSAVQSGDYILSLAGRGYGTTAFSNNAGLAGFQAEENWTDAAMGTRWVIGTTPNGGTIRLERLRIDNSGLITGTGSLGAWTAYTPTLAGTGWAIGNGTAVGYYCQIGKIVHFRAIITFGSTSNYGASAAPTVTLPVTASAADTAGHALHCILNDVSVAFYLGVARINTTTTCALHTIGTSGLFANVTATAPFSWGNGDKFFITGTYEAA